jgi:His/Glu/Gln/Arg/opine family amino acid ABC transporter permease subunit
MGMPSAQVWHSLLPVLLYGFRTTLLLAACSIAVAFVAGLLLAIARRSRHRAVRNLVRAYVELVRGTPALTQLFIVFFGLAQYGINLPAFLAAVVGLGLNGAAYVSEILRAGFESLDDGQRQAALSLGLTPAMTTRYILVPQVLKAMALPLCAFGVQLLKDTSLASVIATPELMFRARILVSETYRSAEIYLIVGLLYLSVTVPFSLTVGWLRRRRLRTA